MIIKQTHTTNFKIFVPSHLSCDVKKPVKLLHRFGWQNFFKVMLHEYESRVGFSICPSLARIICVHSKSRRPSVAAITGCVHDKAARFFLFVLAQPLSLHNPLGGVESQVWYFPHLFCQTWQKLLYSFVKLKGVKK